MNIIWLFQSQGHYDKHPSPLSATGEARKIRALGLNLNVGGRGAQGRRWRQGRDSETQPAPQHSCPGLPEGSKRHVLGPCRGPAPERVPGSTTSSICILWIPLPLQVSVKLLLHWGIPLTMCGSQGGAKGERDKHRGGGRGWLTSSGTALAAGLKNHKKCPSVESIVERTSWLHPKWNIWCRHTRTMFLVRVTDKYITSQLTL